MDEKTRETGRERERSHYRKLLLCLLLIKHSSAIRRVFSQTYLASICSSSPNIVLFSAARRLSGFVIPISRRPFLISSWYSRKPSCGIIEKTFRSMTFAGLTKRWQKLTLLHCYTKVKETYSGFAVVFSDEVFAETKDTEHQGSDDSSSVLADRAANETGDIPLLRYQLQCWGTKREICGYPYIICVLLYSTDVHNLLHSSVFSLI